MNRASGGIGGEELSWRVLLGRTGKKAERESETLGAQERSDVRGVFIAGKAAGCQSAAALGR
jgi:hypothetical protein